MISLHHEIFGRQYAQTATLVMYSPPNHSVNAFGISTRNGNIIVMWGDIIPNSSYTTSKNIDATLAGNNSNNISMTPNRTYTESTGAISYKILRGLKDVYSISIGGYGISLSQDWGDFIKQFIALYSVKIDNPHSNSYINGNMAKMPNSLEKFYIRDFRNSGNFYVNVDDFDAGSNLKDFRITYGQYGHMPNLNTYGNLAKLPPQLYYFKLLKNTGTFTFTGSKTWASAFDTLDLGSATMGLADIDRLLNSMASSITSAIGGKKINIVGYYTSASQTAYNYLVSLGFTITGLSLYVPYELRYDFNGNFNEASGINNLVQTGTLTFTTDRKGGNTAVQFGSGYLQTVNNLPSSSVWSLSFWVKSNQTNAAVPLELSTDYNTNNNSFAFILNDLSQRYFGAIKNSNYNVKTPTNNTTTDNILTNVWKHVVIIFDTTQTALNEIKFYIDGVAKTTITVSGANTESINPFSSYKLFIGARSGNIAPYTGILDDIKIFNRVLTQTEITNLYNE